MKYAEIEYSDKKRSEMSNWLNFMFKPYVVENISLKDADGYKITINVPKNYNEERKKVVFDKVKIFLNENDVGTHAGIDIGYGNYASGNLIGILSTIQKLECQCEVVIVEGERCLTETAICVACNKVKYISLLCNDIESYNDVWKYYFNEFGINIQIINSFKHDNFINADEIVSCRNINRKYSNLARKENILYASDERIRFLYDENISIKNRAELIENMDLTALTSY